MADQLFRLITLLDSHFAADAQLPADAVRWREFRRSVKDALDLVQTTLRKERQQGVPLTTGAARKLEGLGQSAE